MRDREELLWFADEAKEQISQACGEQEKAILLLSSDLSCRLCAKIASDALGERFFGIFADSGLLRRGEAEEMLEFYRTLDMTLVRFDDANRSLYRLNNLSKSEQKRFAVKTEKEYLLLSNAKRHHCSCALFTREQLAYGIRVEPRIFSAALYPVSTLETEELRELARLLEVDAGEFGCNTASPYDLALNFSGPLTAGVVEILRDLDAIWRQTLSLQGINTVSCACLGERQEDGRYPLRLWVSSKDPLVLSRALEAALLATDDFRKYSEIGDICLQVD